MEFSTSLPIDAALPALQDALRDKTAAVLVAPPGAGKTTRVPLALLDAPWVGSGKIIVLEPRRIAARAAAERMAKTLGEKVGDTVGLRVRFSSQVSKRTRIEIVTEGVFTRMILDDPSLDGVAAVLFDEFHERSLDADMALALTLDAQSGLREDLRILVMSATLDGARVAKLLGDGAPVVESEGRAFPVETRHLGRDQRAPIERQMTDAILRALDNEPGSVLAFLPGAGEIRRTETFLRERLSDPSISVVPLYGALDRDVQDAAIQPLPKGTRKVVLATSIAETSITIDGVRIVIDCGLARVPRYEPDVGVTRLETVRVSRAAADQRRGRAGRTEPGICYRLWDEPQTASLAAFAEPEIRSADLTSFVLDLAQWGVTEPTQLRFLDPPPAPALKEAQNLLRTLGALDAGNRITDEGRALQKLPLPPRLARMIVDAAREGAGTRAADIAAIVSERGLGGDSVDLVARLDGLRRDRSKRGDDARRMAKRWAEMAGASRDTDQETSAGEILSLAYPERIAKNRGNTGAFLLANGRGAQLDPTSPLARESYLTVAELTGSAAQSRIVLAAPITLAEIETRFGDRIEKRNEITFDPNTKSLRGRVQRRLGAIALSDATQKVTPNDETVRVLTDGIVALGLSQLPWSEALTQWRDRVMFLRTAEGDEWPDLSDAALAASAHEWLAPVLADKTALSQLGADDLSEALHQRLDWSLRRKLDTDAPTHFEAPTESRFRIDYANPAGPSVAVRVPELYGLTQHPSVAGGRVPIVLELLSPAHRPVQVTRDLPGFWRGSYAAVRTEMRGRYPRHPWPEDPTSAPPTRRAKPRGT
ncbi:ATP-dependent RNA helicase HrpB [Variibacter gotjawalensis]|uniref:ATP-dependent RNA helicase HrpB n=1 Tax=Variibacter gotjawalensis TaxID=1333996 RepID=A0A0S3PQF7_9BRAD|nr:ATP-dependent helicase HrpB [Variibacter gotjawalensis]NIK48465.1 ATP-dependent helicase HrpB [Variibacter gotjawalensis]RZS50332.1 ATP-dependent helicase HrpB [Variibacter gotjawalensis]BAT58165.1 ATP-dependent RNA helicase HrpB [Variibacter gotjawalensis]